MTLHVQILLHRITPQRFGREPSNFKGRLPRSQGWMLSIWGSEGQRSCSQAPWTSHSWLTRLVTMTRNLKLNKVHMEQINHTHMGFPKLKACHFYLSVFHLQLITCTLPRLTICMWTPLMSRHPQDTFWWKPPPLSSAAQSDNQLVGYVRGVSLVSDDDKLTILLDGCYLDRPCNSDLSVTKTALWLHQPMQCFIKPGLSIFQVQKLGQQ